MKSKFLIATAAIALLAGTSAVSAQDKMPQSPAASAPMKSDAGQPAARGQEGGPMAPGMNTQRSDSAKPGMMRGKQAQDTSPNGREPSGRGDATSDGKTPKKSVEGRDRNPSGDHPSSAERHDGGRDHNRNRAAANDDRQRNLTPQQRIKIRQSFRHHGNAPRVKNVNFNISIGAKIPARIRLAPVPVQVIEYYPRWRGYRFFIVGDEIIIVRPRTLEIVAVLPA